MPFIIGGAALLGGGLSYLGSKKAGDAASTGASDSAATTKQMFDISREDMSPFLEAATGKYTTVPRMVTDGPFSGQTFATTQEFQPGALQQFQQGIDQAPGLPTIYDPVTFGQERPTFAEMGDRFQGDRFSYDPNQAMQSPDIQFLQEQGEQGLMRSLAGNRQLGSGNRLLDFMKFNQGLASQGLNDYYNRQLEQNKLNYGRDMGENKMSYQRGIDERAIGIQDIDRDRQRQLDNAARIQQAALDRYGLAQGQYSDRMSRLGDLINVGSGAGGVMSQGALNTGQALSNIYTGLGASQGAASMGRLNAIGNTIGDIGKLYGMNQAGYFDNPYSNQATLQGLPAAGSGFYGNNR